MGHSATQVSFLSYDQKRCRPKGLFRGLSAAATVSGVPGARGGGGATQVHARGGRTESPSQALLTGICSVSPLERPRTVNVHRGAASQSPSSGLGRAPEVSPSQGLEHLHRRARTELPDPGPTVTANELGLHHQPQTS